MDREDYLQVVRNAVQEISSYKETKLNPYLENGQSSVQVYAINPSFPSLLHSPTT